MNFTKEQIKLWKQQHGELFQFSAGEKSCILKKPTRKALSYAAVAGAADPLKYNEVLLNDCWVAGDEEIKTDNGLFLSISARIPELVEMVEFELVKL